MRELSANEIDVVSGAGLWYDILVGVLGNMAYDSAKVVYAGPGPVSSPTGGFGVVGPGSFSATNPSSAGAVNGCDKESDAIMASGGTSGSMWILAD